MTEKYQAGYDFRSDEFMQEMGRYIFPKGENVTKTKTPKGQVLLSYLVIDEKPYTCVAERHNPQNIKIYIYPEYDPINGTYNIVTLITIFDEFHSRSYTVVITGDKPLTQNDYLKTTFSENTIYEIWSKTPNEGAFTNCIVPITKVEFNNKPLLKKIIEWNKHDMKRCKICGNVITRFNNKCICQECISKQNVLRNHNRNE